MGVRFCLPFSTVSGLLEPWSLRGALAAIALTFFLLQYQLESIAWFKRRMWGVRGPKRNCKQKTKERNKLYLVAKAWGLPALCRPPMGHGR